LSYFAVVLSRARQQWSAAEIDLGDVEDFDGLIEEATAQVEDGFDVAVIAVEEDDEWLALVRADADGDARVFLSDTRALTTSSIASLFGDAVEGQPVADPEEETDDEEEAAGGAIDAEPGGDPGLVSDLGTTAAALLELCAKEGALPGDVTAAVCERAGCLDVYDALRGT
jgi:putative tRNA adenosine deaminase-associated protein